MPTTRQTSFSTGELSPRLYGRTDLELFGHGLRKASNWLINKQGNALTRPGTRWCKAAKERNSVEITLVPYVAPSGNRYLCEFGLRYVRPYLIQSGALVPTSELVTPFNDPRMLQWSQVGRSLILTDGTSLPQELILEPGGAGSPMINPARIGPPGETPATATSLEPIFPSIDGNPPKMPCLVEWVPTQLFVVDAAHPPREWIWRVSTTVRHKTTGEIAETLAAQVTQYTTGSVSSGVVGGAVLDLSAQNNMVVLYSDAPVYLAPGYGADGAVSTDWECIGYNYYRGRGELFGFVGSTASNAPFADFGDEPNYKVPPLRGDNPFKVSTPRFGVLPNYPRAVAHFQQRRVFGGCKLQDSTFFASAVDAFGNFDAPKVNWEGQPLEATLVNRQQERIVALGQLEQLIALTDTSVWAIGRQTDPLDYSTLGHNVRLLDEVGSLQLQPVVVDGALLYARSRGHGVRAVVPAGDGGGLQGNDVSWHAEHLFRGASSGIRSWCVNREQSLVWACRTDGRLMSCTRTTNGWAWATHITGGLDTIDPAAAETAFDFALPSVGSLSTVEGELFLSVATVPETDGEAVYAAVYRGNGVQIERLMGRHEEEANLNFSLDSHLVFSLPSGVPNYQVSGLDHLEGRLVWAASPGFAPQGPFTVRDGKVVLPVVGGLEQLPRSPYLTSTNVNVAIGLAYTCDLELLDAAPGRFTEKNVVRVGFEVETAAASLKVGQDFEHLVPWSRRQVTDSYDYPSNASALVVVNVKGAWGRTGRAAIRQDKPEVVRLLGITREYDAGG